MVGPGTSNSSFRAALGRPGRIERVLGVPLSVSVRGDGPVLVCLHAAGHGSRDFDLLSVPARIVTVDWPGHGLSGHDPEPASAARYADLAEALLDKLNLGPAVLLGCSIGGAVATQLAVRRPDLVSGLVLCNSGGFAAQSRLERAFCRAMSWAYRKRRWWFRRFYRAKYKRLLRGQHAAGQRERIIDAGEETAPVLAQLWASFASPEADIRYLAPQVPCPVLLAWARSDPFNGHRRLPALAQFERHLHLFPGGHAPFLEAPDRFAALLSPWIEVLALARAA